MVVVSLESVSGGSLNEAKIHDQVYEALSEALIQGQDTAAQAGFPAYAGP